jgi:hypothetical protein
MWLLLGLRLENEYSRSFGGNQKFGSAVRLVACDRGFTVSKLREDWDTAMVFVF